jgi:hypothetical protein
VTSNANRYNLLAWASGFGPVSCGLCSGTSSFGPGSSGLCSGNSGPISGSSRSGSYGGLSYMGPRSVVWGGLSVFGHGHWGFGGDGEGSVMIVDGWVSGSGSS